MTREQREAFRALLSGPIRKLLDDAPDAAIRATLMTELGVTMKGIADSIVGDYDVERQQRSAGRQA